MGKDIMSPAKKWARAQKCASSLGTKTMLCYDIKYHLVCYI